ncbi:MAG TPA: DUF1761 domain-containing protein [Candidatus Paceibacterota bacterium]
MNIEINYWMVLLVGFVSVMLGAFWYSPKGFGKTWMAATGMTMGGSDIDKKSINKKYAITFLASLLGAYVMAHLVGITQLVTFWQGVQLGFWIWIGFIVPSMLGPMLWERKTWNYFIVNTGYYLVLFMLSAGILSEWGVKIVL